MKNFLSNTRDNNEANTGGLLNQLPEHVQTKLEEAINNPSQTKLDLSELTLTDECMSIAADLLPFTNIKTLDVQFNNIGAAGASALAKNKTLTTLDVRFNNIGAEKNIRINATIHRNRRAVEDYLNEVNVLGQLLRSKDECAYWTSPDIIENITKQLALQHGFFSNNRKRETFNALYPKCKFNPTEQAGITSEFKTEDYGSMLSL